MDSTPCSSATPTWRRLRGHLGTPVTQTFGSGDGRLVPDPVRGEGPRSQAQNAPGPPTPCRNPAQRHRGTPRPSQSAIVAQSNCVGPTPPASQVRNSREEAADELANRNAANPATRALGVAVTGTSTQVDKPANLSTVLLIRRFRVRAPDAPQGLTCAYASRVSYCLDYFANGKVRFSRAQGSHISLMWRPRYDHGSAVSDVLRLRTVRMAVWLATREPCAGLPTDVTPVISEYGTAGHLSGPERGSHVGKRPSRCSACGGARVTSLRRKVLYLL